MLIHNNFSGFTEGWLLDPLTRHSYNAVSEICAAFSAISAP